ncbi:DHHC palmitoyltransferase-domain-containing protein [Pilobolus umbonatus]|nr:DHHC palmitoyltransferase-domain-containing protein [Pilobolus umbonatus]
MSLSALAIQRCLMRIVNASPVILLYVIFIWSYWAYNIVLALDIIQKGHTVQGVLYSLFYHPLFLLCIWSYWSVCHTSPGYSSDVYSRDEEAIEFNSIGEDIRLLNAMEDSDSHTVEYKHNTVISPVEDIPLGSTHNYLPEPITVKRDGAKRFCQKCKLDKFDRTHHCRLCNRCVLKMDHHCPWINNCVGFNNYKQFYLFLFYASIYCIYIFSTILPYIISQLNEPLGVLGLNINWILMIFISGLFGLFLVPFTCFHTRQICKNRTTIEFYEKSNYKLGRPRHGRVDIMRSKYFNPWDIGTRKNVEQVLGKPSWNLLLPLGKPIGDGTFFPLSAYAYDTLGAEDQEED